MPTLFLAESHPASFVGFRLVAFGANQGLANRCLVTKVPDPLSGKPPFWKGRIHSIEDTMPQEATESPSVIGAQEVLLTARTRLATSSTNDGVWRWETWPDGSTQPPAVSIVAKSNTGKTTLLEALLPILKSRGLQVGVLKHHSHQSSFDVPGKDTYRLAEAGADIVVGASPVQVAVFRRENGSGDLDAVLGSHFAGMDLVLIEGYKRGPYPKIEVHRAARSRDLICGLDELLAVVSDQSWKLPSSMPLFRLDDPLPLAHFLAARVAPADRATRNRVNRG